VIPADDEKERQQNQRLWRDAFPHFSQSKQHFPKKGRGRAKQSQYFRLSSAVMIFFEKLRRAISGERIRGRTGRYLDRGCCRFRCWSRRESAWPKSEGISAMGGTPGPAPRSMQLPRPSLLSYLQRFNKKRRIHYKVDVLPRWRSDTLSPRIQAVTRVQRPAAKESSRAY
jgi:hypothetical protein